MGNFVNIWVIVGLIKLLLNADGVINVSRDKFCKFGRKRPDSYALALSRSAIKKLLWSLSRYY